MILPLTQISTNVADFTPNSIILHFKATLSNHSDLHERTWAL
jgi:hypothetical protein